MLPTSCSLTVPIPPPTYQRARGHEPNQPYTSMH